MTRRIAFAPAAQLDLAEAVAWYIQPGAGAGAARRPVALQSGIYGLLTHPYLGRRMDHDRPTVVTARFWAIYGIFPDTGQSDIAGDVTILRILGPGQMN